MRGDLSKHAFPPNGNYTGVLHQQGRVLLDQDWNDEHHIGAHLRQILARDVIGAGVAAVPADATAGFRVLEATATALGVNVTLTTGRVWVDGLHLELNAPPVPVMLPASYYGPPVQSPQEIPNTINEESRDAVILELWEETLSAFQDPVNLLEPALGGPDTTERIQLNFVLRLFRLGPDEDCRSIAGQLRTDPNLLGKLTVTPSPVVVIGGDCPVDTGGGYTGLEHYLYRIEITSPDTGGDARFKWSRFNGGLVGRGQLAGNEVTIVANQQMINHCGLTDFYLEALNKPGPHQPWEVAFTAEASLVSDGVLLLTNPTGTWPGGNSAFFRLWDGVRRISDFNTPTELENGIQLDFDPVSASGNYRPGDHWTFPVRAAGTGFDPSVWPNNQPPQGVVYHRAPLAEIHWPDVVTVTAEAPADIHDCRSSFPPLTRRQVCCTYTVGDGVTTYGDFNAIEEAVDSLPTAGGEICLMPGTHTANVRIANRKNITIHGCGKHTRVIPREESRQDPIVHIFNSRGITISHLDLATFDGTAIVVEGTEPSKMSEIEIAHNRIVAFRNGILVANGSEIWIHHNRIRVIDKDEGLEAILLMAEGALIERNDLGVVPAEENPPREEGEPDRPRPEDPCADPEPVYRSPSKLGSYLEFIFLLVLELAPRNPYKALGGIRLSGGAERVKVLENTINGGAGDGIHLGGVIVLPEQPPEGLEPEAPVKLNAGEISGRVQLNGQPADDIALSFRRSNGAGQPWFTATNEDGVFAIDDDAITAGPYMMRMESPGYELVSASQVPGGSAAPRLGMINAEIRAAAVTDRIIPSSVLQELLIERNEITNMGLSGIGVSAPAQTSGDIAAVAGISVSIPFGTLVLQLEIHANYVHHCLRNRIVGALLGATSSQGLGGISLGFCDEVTISANRIEHNGTRHFDPVTGIYVALVDHIEIRDNAIHNNGPVVAGDGTMQEGIRGGIVVRAMARLARSADDTTLAGLDQSAGRIYDNVVRQPVGQALFLLSLGPVSVQNNFLSSERRGPMSHELLAGTVLIINTGTRERVGVLIGSSGGTTTDVGAAVRLSPDGKTLYADNQVRLGKSGDSYTGQFIWTGGDLGYDANQADYLGPGVVLSNLPGMSVSFFINTVLSADTVRAGDSRFKEAVPPRSFVLSLLSMAKTMNNTSDNQGDHCIFANTDAASTVATVSTPNQVGDDTFCSSLADGMTAVIRNRAVYSRF